MFLLYRSMETLHRYFPLWSKSKCQQVWDPVTLCWTPRILFALLYFLYTHKLATRKLSLTLFLMASLAGMKLLSTSGEQPGCLCLHMERQWRLEPGRDGHTQVANHQPSSQGGIFWFWVSTDSVAQICVSMGKREMCYYIQTKGGNASFFLQIIFWLCLEGAGWRRREMGRKGKGRANICALHCACRREYTTPVSAQHCFLVMLFDVANVCRKLEIQRDILQW